MRVAYIILAHTNPAHIARLARKLAEPPWAEVLIHVDKKQDQQPFEDALGDCPRTAFVKERVAVYWAGFSSVRATVNSLQQAWDSGEFQRYVLLQGLDYPLFSNEELYRFFEEHRDTEFIKAKNASQSPLLADTHKYTYHWYWDNPNLFQKLANKFHMFCLKVLKWDCGTKLKFVMVDSKRFDIFDGWAHIALTGECVGYILAFYRDHPGFNRYFETAYASDESYFHTIVYNSEFVKHTVVGGPVKREADKRNLTYFEYPKGVRIFRSREELPYLMSKGYPFFRKADGQSGPLLDAIDQAHEKQRPL